MGWASHPSSHHDIRSAVSSCTSSLLRRLRLLMKVLLAVYRRVGSYRADTKDRRYRPTEWLMATTTTTTIPKHRGWRLHLLPWQHKRMATTRGRCRRCGRWI